MNAPKVSFALATLLVVKLLSPLAAFAHTPAEDMADAANHFLAALTPEQVGKATFEFRDNERTNWHFIPKPRKGLPFGEMTPSQHLLGYALLNSGLSQRGFMKASTIMSLDAILKDIERGSGPTRDPELYFVSIFGKPDAKGTWGWRVEGHHLALNFLIVSGKEISVTPSFFGANPAEVREGPRKGLRVLGSEENLARQLVKSLDAEQRKVAIYTNTAPRDIITGADRKARVLTPTGLSAAKMKPSQAELLHQLIREYVQRCRSELADADLKKIQSAGLEKLSFAWAGGTEPGEGHYYRVQGPGFLLEYDNTQNNANHIHAVWRDLENDFGDDILRRHYEQSPHGK
jgi:hypothetical protein